MIEVTIVSGKGGVGKTTLTASLSYLLRDKVRITTSDCDVDAPNLSLILGGKEIESMGVKSAEKAKIDYEKCIRCKICVDKCIRNAIVWDEEKNRPYIFELLCEGCGTCGVVCPVKAIELVEVENGFIKVYESRYRFKLVSGETKLGETGSGKIVSEVKKKAKEVAEEEGSDILLVDGPPGSDCAAIASISGSNFIVLVAEPTPTSLSDVKKVYRVVEHFGIKSGIVINKSTISDRLRRELLKFSEEKGITFLGEIPMDRNIPISISMSKPVVEYAPRSESSKAIEEIKERILDAIT
ncbi:MAG: ATP-binding protein [Candidatus Odinarchaeota archaeon]|nr:ATP-binding protein [Candidatus Odinarchaeota archaeon]